MLSNPVQNEGNCLELDCHFSPPQVDHCLRISCIQCNARMSDLQDHLAFYHHKFDDLGRRPKFFWNQIFLDYRGSYFLAWQLAFGREFEWSYQSMHKIVNFATLFWSWTIVAWQGYRDQFSWVEHSSFGTVSRVCIFSWTVPSPIW